jgi:hypothetical protein
VAPFSDEHVSLDDVDLLDPDVVALSQKRLPARPLGAAERRPEEGEVHRAVVRQDDELAAMVLDLIEDTLAARDDHSGRRFGRCRRDVVPLTRDVALRLEGDKSAVLRRADSQEVTLIFFLEHLFVL